jgi:enamine deaminase RidA (YjgF/YER057c/UK114 family)
MILRLRTFVVVGIACIANTLTIAQSSDKVQRVPYTSADIPISGAVVVPPGHDTIYVSGTLPKVANASAPKGSPESFGDTKTQTMSVLQQIEETLSKQQLSMADVVMMHVYLVGDPKKDGKMDFAGMMEAYKQFFGTDQQPNKPARSTVQVAALALPGALVEIEVIAVRKRGPQAQPVLAH